MQKGPEGGRGVSAPRPPTPRTQDPSWKTGHRETSTGSDWERGQERPGPQDLWPHGDSRPLGWLLGQWRSPEQGGTGWWPPERRDPSGSPLPSAPPCGLPTQASAAADSRWAWGSGGPGGDPGRAHPDLGVAAASRGRAAPSSSCSQERPNPTQRLQTVPPPASGRFPSHPAPQPQEKEQGGGSPQALTDGHSSPNTQLTGAEGPGTNRTQGPQGGSLSASRPPPPQRPHRQAQLSSGSATMPLSQAEQRSPSPRLDADLQQEVGILSTGAQVQGP